MSELDEAWAIALAQAESQARAAGRRDISDYIALRSSNDLLRKISSDWLLKMFVTVAGEANRAGAAIQTSRGDSHSFNVGNARMVGRSLTLVNGVRAITVEVGWPRTPRDGFIRGGGLACGNIKHLGIKSASQAIRLMLTEDGTPKWAVEGERARKAQIHEDDIRKHIAILIGASRRHSQHS